MKGLPAYLIKGQAMNAELYSTDSLKMKGERVVQKWSMIIG
jgi:hypothetical protein